MILDEHGREWRVIGGDPAAKLVSRLRAKRYSLIVLPFRTLATGELDRGCTEPASLINEVRLADCLAVLEEVA